MHRAVRAKLFFLPPRSPDPNSIELGVAKLKHLMRNAQPHSTVSTWRKVGDLVLASDECANYLVNSGCDSAYTHHALGGVCTRRPLGNRLSEEIHRTPWYRKSAITSRKARKSSRTSR